MTLGQPAHIGKALLKPKICHNMGYKFKHGIQTCKKIFGLIPKFEILKILIKIFFIIFVDNLLKTFLNAAFSQKI